MGNQERQSLETARISTESSPTQSGSKTGKNAQRDARGRTARDRERGGVAGGLAHREALLGEAGLAHAGRADEDDAGDVARDDDLAEPLQLLRPTGEWPDDAHTHIMTVVRPVGRP